MLQSLKNLWAKMPWVAKSAAKVDSIVDDPIANWDDFVTARSSSPPTPGTVVPFVRGSR